jgi:hydroxymethylpyrimidine pyrophosphatase-like HAD family hydrolase
MPNDLPMLAWAGTSFAVANGHLDVLSVATHTCPTNDEDGVAQTLEVALAQTHEGDTS